MTEMRDVIIVGGGIAAHTAAIYAARAEMKPLVLSGKGLDQLSTTTDVENFPGFPDGVQGPDLVNAAKKQAQKFGAEYKGEDVNSLTKKGKTYVLKTSEASYETKTVIICTGASARKIGIPGEDKYWGRGVATCAPCDAPLYRDKKVLVVGGGDAAIEEAIVLAKFATHVTIAHRRDEFRASKAMQKKAFSLKKEGKLTILWDTVPTEVVGETFVAGVKIKNVKSGKESLLGVQGMFLAIGHIPSTSWLEGSGIELSKGYIPAVKTSLPGVFAAGDVMDWTYRQAVTSAGTGCQAALEAERFLEGFGK